jgi:hypothetical protein
MVSNRILNTISVSTMIALAGVTASFAADEPVARAVFTRYVADNGPSCEFNSKVRCSTSSCETLNVNNGLCGDPQTGAPKKGYVAYTCSWSATPATLPGAQALLRPLKKIAVANEGAQLSFQCAGEAPLPVHKATIAKIKARYYDASGPSRTCDFTKFAVGLCEGSNSCSLPANNSLCGDPASGGGKTAEISYECQQGWTTSTPRSRQTRSASEGQTLVATCD